MLALLDFIDRYAIDPHIYFSVPGRGEARVELYWDRTRGEEKWQVGALGSEDKQTCRYQDLPRLLRRHGADLIEVENQLRTVAFTQVFFADSLSAEARKLFGEEEISRAIEEHERFLRDLRETVRQLTRQPLRVIEGEGRDTSPPRARLSLVPPELQTGS